MSFRLMHALPFRYTMANPDEQRTLAMKRCSYCGKEGADEARYCGECGSEFSPPDALETEAAPPIQPALAREAGTVLPGSSREIVRCPHCGGTRVVAGTVVSPGDGNSGVFRPAGLKALSLTLVGGVPLREAGHACADCGCVWGAVDPRALEQFLRRHCNPPGV